MKSEKVCPWPRLGKAEVCGRPCIGEYWRVHLDCLRRGSRGPMVCKLCGVGVRSKIALCMSCGHDRVAHQIAYVKKNGLDATQLFIACWVRDHATQLEFHRLAAIDV